MKRKRTFVRLGVAAFGFAASLSLADADEAVAPPASAPPISNEAVTLQGFGMQNPLCREWSDGCAICLRDEKGAARCSTPGIACQPTPIVCRQAKAQ
ncbi:hypothetical protein [Methylocapsa sp. S129]|uniref:hypothetical protein n=1 Tax=Methylocapsa sp. S129 TaxID=1641869 RepID=UPI00131ECA42|nr:hypothetical protein [Methylocapsa sp. S129]